MKIIPPLLCGVFLLTVTPTASAETLFGPGTINIATNEAILINTIGGEPGGSQQYEIYVDGLKFSDDGGSFELNRRFAIAGPHNLAISNNFLITFQRLQGSSIKTTLISQNSTNAVSIPEGKTLQMLGDLNDPGISVHPQNTQTVYQIWPLSAFADRYSYPAVTGPATIKFWAESDNTLVSYYFTDEVLQLPPQGFLKTLGPSLEVNIEKSYDLTNWIPTGAFNTEAEARAFYRLRILK